MIVVDTNLIAYAVLPGERTADALRVADRDSNWVAPAGWRRELRVLGQVLNGSRDPQPQVDPYSYVNL